MGPGNQTPDTRRPTGDNGPPGVPLTKQAEAPPTLSNLKLIDMHNPDTGIVQFIETITKEDWGLVNALTRAY